MATTKQKDGLIMQPVDAPPAAAPRRTVYVDIVSQLAEHAGQWFLVRKYNSPQSAQSGRQAVVKCAKTMGHTAQATANGVDLYAKVDKKRGRQPAKP